MKSYRKNNISRYILLLLFSLVFIVPFGYAVYTSLLSKSDIDKFVPLWKLTFENYKYVLKESDILVWYKNSIIMTAGIMIGNLIINTMAGYSLAKLRYPGRKIIFFL